MNRMQGEEIMNKLVFSANDYILWIRYVGTLMVSAAIEYVPSGIVTEYESVADAITDFQAITGVEV
jgi:hypothetical protein